MPKGNRANALGGQWKTDFDAWKAKTDPYFDEIESERLEILVWGPGESSPEYAKRIQICEHLYTVNPNNNAATSEMLIRNDSRYKRFADYPEAAEEIHWRSSNLVIVLIPREKRATGPRAEVMLFSQEVRFREKAWLIVPRITPKERRQWGFLDRAWKLYPRTKQCRYTDEEFADCTKIRAFCSEVADKLRTEIYVRRLRLRDVLGSP
jgi:hypothetical protein